MSYTFRVKSKCRLLGSKVLPHDVAPTHISDSSQTSPPYFLHSDFSVLLSDLCITTAYSTLGSLQKLRLLSGMLPPISPQRQSHKRLCLLIQNSARGSPLSEESSLANKQQALLYYSWSITMLSFLHSKYCYLMLSCLFITWLLPRHSTLLESRDLV